MKVPFGANRLGLSGALVAVVVGLVLCGSASAVTTLTLGDGSAVTSIDRSATFDVMTSSYTSDLNLYIENGLKFTCAGQNWGADPALATIDPFHVTPTTGGFMLPAYGSEEWTTIQTPTLNLMYGVEFLYGNGWTTGDIYGQYPWGNSNATLEWQTWTGGSLVSSGSVAYLTVGTVVGFSDDTGFDQLWVRSTTAGNGTLSALAVDNVNVQVTAIPEPSSGILVAVSLFALLGLIRRHHPWSNR